MPAYLRPQTHIQHRVAAIALYRALLLRCTATPSLQDEERTSLHNAIRNKFRQNRKLQSPRQLGIVFRAGYEVLNHLDGSVAGNPKSTEALRTLIPSLPRGITRAPPRPRRPPPVQKTQHASTILPPEQAVLNVRPYAKTTGPRHVPILASANGIPFLRFKKPQPEALSRVIRQKLNCRITNFHQKVLLTNYWKPIAQYEDEWDDILEEECGFVDDEEEQGIWEPMWQHAPIVAEKENWVAHEKDVARDKRITARMIALVDKERELALQEGQKVLRGRKHKPIRDQWLK